MLASMKAAPAAAMARLREAGKSGSLKNTHTNETMATYTAPAAATIAANANDFLFMTFSVLLTSDDNWPSISENARRYPPVSSNRRIFVNF
jgi:hypothetical protein